MVTLISHFYNEELLLPYFLRHHLPLFDHGILIDYHSTDRSVEICRELAPHWELRTSRNPDFAAVPCDQEVQDIEETLSGWKVCLNTTEFIFHPDLRGVLARFEERHPPHMALGMPAVVMIDPPETHDRELDDRDLIYQCRHGFVDAERSLRYPRFIHRMPRGQYSPGRHYCGYPFELSQEVLHLWFGWAPWPHSIPRKLQIQQRIPDWDRAQGHGVQHFLDQAELERIQQGYWSRAGDLWDDVRYRGTLEAFALQRAPLG